MRLERHRQAERRYRASAHGSIKRRADDLMRKTARKIENRAKLDAIKAVPCADCKQRFPPVCMDFDHRPSETKKRDVSAMMHRPWQTVLLEIAKCDLVCANCHRIRSATREHAKRVDVPQLELSVGSAP
jgi:hypothetical protein